MNLAFVSRFGTKKDCACVSSASTVIMFQMKTAWRQDLSCILVCVFCASVTYGMSVDFSRLRKPYLLPKRADSCKFQVLLFSLCLLSPFLQIWYINWILYTVPEPISPLLVVLFRIFKQHFSTNNIFFVSSFVNLEKRKKMMLMFVRIKCTFLKHLSLYVAESQQVIALFLCVWSFSSHSIIFHSYGDVR